MNGKFRLTVFSDTHGNVRALEQALPIINQSDWFVFLGDGNADIDKIESRISAKIVRVRGNCDIACSLPAESVVRVGETDFFVTHGNAYGVKSGLFRLAEHAVSVGCPFALYGHTHRAAITEFAGTTLINPGTASRGANKTYVVIEGDGKTFTARIMNL